VLVGFVVLVSRYKAVTQSLGYLVLENGIFIFGMLLVEAIPLVVEMGMLLDLFVGIFVISIITNHINRAFSSMDTRRLVSLKE
jgi:hydrogenase-4 component E